MISFRINIQSSIEENKNLKSKINSYIEGQEQIYINAEKVESYWNDDNIKTFIEYITNDRKKVNALEDTILSCTEINNNYFIKLDTILEQNDIPYKNKYLIYNSDDCQKSINKIKETLDILSKAQSNATGTGCSMDSIIIQIGANIAQQIEGLTDIQNKTKAINNGISSETTATKVKINNLPFIEIEDNELKYNWNVIPITVENVSSMYKNAISQILNNESNITYAAESIEKMNEQTTEGEFLAKGMPTNEYQSTKNKTFKEVVSSGTYEDIDYDISKYYSYKDIDNFVENLTRHSMVKTYIAGYSGQGRKIYLLEVGTGSKTIILAGGVHARETAGPSYILKGLSDLVRKAETEENAKKILTDYKFVAIPCVNPDGREMVINGKYSLKANANYVDIGRNFPTSNAMQYKFGNSHSRYEEKPSYSHYCGPYLGSESETQAVMAVLNKYIPTASYLIDYHQSGKGVYGGKLYDEKNKASKSAHFRDAIRKHIGYSKINEEKELRGGGEGSLSDYATEVASGFVFSDFYGRLTYNGDPLLIYNDIDKHKEYYNPVNKNIKIVTLEIGSSSTRGYSSSTRQKQKEEYKKFDDLLQWIVKYDKKYD